MEIERMIKAEKIKEINGIGQELEKFLHNFYGKITFNFYNGKYVNSNVEQSIKIDNLNERSEK